MITGVGRSGSRWFYGKIPGSNVTGFRIDGIEDVTRNINNVLRGMKGRSHAGLLAAANYVLNDADQTSPRVPALTGALRSSRFAEPQTSMDGDPFVILGYKANYAAAVHEMMSSPSGMPINWTRPGSGPKFLQASLFRNAGNIPAIVGRHI